MAQVCFAVTILAVLFMTQGITAKRGCSAFGHSCFGGHGKRSGDTAVMDTTAELRRQLGQEETPPHPVYPHSGYSGLLPPGDDIIPVRDGGVYEREDSAREAVKFKLRNFVKQWMDNYRRSQQNNDDSYIIDNL
ncbi:unnamed protein product [Chilo suppressalis]|uniref:CCHamide 2 n=1 Tax=Chilo suppressalis TaxID=168631 RepID=A0A0S1U0C3_CHISP|nr:CCHamide 2 precursor [Chilo suppressalis]RVE50192.1 hypothetical protein evm_005215 [Chilo suppressalis]CAH2981659.1 unnamed protein product [Chilo suppressalis]